MGKLNAGPDFLNDFLDGGYEEGVVSTIYGPAGSGKTLLLMLAMSQAEGRTVFIDTEGGFSTERLAQVCKDHEEVLDNTTFLNPTSFEEQDKAMDKLQDLMNSNISLVCLDTLTTLYRIEMSGEDNYKLNKRLAKQLRSLVELARKKEIPVLVTGQVYADFEDPEKVNVVGGTIVKNMSKCLLELKNEKDHRSLTIKKHRSIKSGKKVEFEIVEEGLEPLG